MNNIISSPDNKVVKHVLKLATSKSYRQQQQQSLLFGETIIAEAHQYNLITAIIVMEASYNKYQAKFNNPGISWHLIDNAGTFKKLNILNIDCDIIAVISHRNKPNITDFYRQNCIILDQIQDPGNLGTILRTAQAAGIHYIVISKNSVDIYNPKVLRATMGIQFQLQILTDTDLNQFLADYSKYQGTVVCCTASAPHSIYQHQFKKYCQTALVFGNEGQGISRQLLEQYWNTAAYIPMHKSAESLNVATAVAIASYEHFRQLNY